MRSLGFSIMVSAVLVFAAACSGGGSAATPAGPAATAAGCSGSAGTPVGIANFAFNPASVTIAKGGVVTWANADTATHTVTFDAGPDCGRVAQGAVVSRTFDTSGTFTYHCTIHSTMKGTVVVQ